MIAFILSMLVVLAVSVFNGCGEQRVERKAEQGAGRRQGQVPERRVVEVYQLSQRQDGLLYERKAAVPFTGTAVDYWPDGTKRAEGEVRDGKSHGTETWWYEDGRKWREVEFRNGEEIGRQEWER